MPQNDKRSDEMAREIELEDPTENMGAQLVKEVASNTHVDWIQQLDDWRKASPIEIRDCANVNTSFPGFVALAQGAGLRIRGER